MLSKSKQKLALGAFPFSSNSKDSMLSTIWGIPALIVGLSVGVSVDQYGNHFFCWLSVHENVVWSLVGPVCLIVIVTLGVFMAALKTSLQCKDPVTNFGTLKTLLWLAIILLPIQGSTWVLAILSVNETHTILQYAFSIFCLIEGIYIFVGYCVINRKVQQQIRFIWLRYIKNKKYPEVHEVQTSLSSSAYSPSTRAYHRSIGISTSSATSRSTSKTCASHKAGSEARLSENLPSTSELEEIPNDRGIYCKHGKYYEQTLRNSNYEQNKGSVKSCMDDLLNRNHSATPCQLSLSAEGNDDKSYEGLKFSECTESTSSGPKMGVNVFSYPRLPGSRSPLSKTSLSLKMGLNSKDPSLSWGSVDSQKSSPLSAPLCSARPEFNTPRMGISGVEKSIHSARDALAETNSLDSNLHLTTAGRGDFKTGICSSCRSQSFSKDTFSDFSSCGSPQYEGQTRSPYHNKSSPIREGCKQAHSSREKCVDCCQITSPRHSQSAGNCERLKSPVSEKLQNGESSMNASKEELSCKLKKTTSISGSNKSGYMGESSSRDTTPSSDSTKAFKQCSSNQSIPDTTSLEDRSSPRLIDDTPSDEEMPMNINFSFAYQTSTTSSDRNDRSYNIPKLTVRSSGGAPPLATAEISDSDFNDAMETAKNDRIHAFLNLLYTPTWIHFYEDCYKNAPL
ncbi:hypothetical protein JTE90_021546 [Oedothorax gibbosus]|uniref:G-protein coupled receptors family 2 profile 2 domain-containing protein n=1 Tax=Oedothorax gibbosus TaxID=931172 RepID=A0AAV6VNP4_9ARAC|nr:hypothetical protein JTE90_021546 [Oedothorax gibbosus]